MTNRATDESKLTFAGMMAQVDRHLTRLAHFHYQWGLTDNGPAAERSRPRLFRYDAERLKHLVIMAEHMIRCLIIWLAHRKMRDETITPMRAGFPRRRSGNSPESQPPIHPLLAERGIPLFEPKLPAFRISLPEHRSSLRTQGSRLIGPTSHRQSKRAPRPRNDDIPAIDLLYDRLDRLDALYASIDDRAVRLAASWAGRVMASPAGINTPATASASTTQSEVWPLSSEGARPSRFTPRPLKSHDPPEDLYRHALPEEAEDVRILHDVAVRAAEGFPALCG